MSNWVDASDVINDVVKAILSCCSISLSPHKFVNIGRELLCIHSLHTLKLELHSGPIRFYILCVDSGSGVNKMLRMIDCFMLLNIWQPLDSAIGTSFIRAHSCSWSDMCLYYW